MHHQMWRSLAALATLPQISNAPLVHARLRRRGTPAVASLLIGRAKGMRPRQR
jgi:hypothetical protein